jgi:pimeloyl-ACP methyl ester carboxylesterase
VVGNDTERGAAILMGHNLGGVVASEFAFRNPSLVRVLVLIDPAYYATALLHRVRLL